MQPLPSFVASVPKYRFGGRDAVYGMEQVIQRQAEQSTLHRIEQKDLPKIGPTGLVSVSSFRDYRFTKPAFRDYTNSLLGSLSTSMLRLIDTANSDARLPSAYKLAAAFLNNLVTIYPERMVNHKLLVDASAKQVVGCVGPKYRLLKNASFWRLVKMQLDSMAGAPRLFEAQLHGRQLTACCVGSVTGSHRSDRLMRGVWAVNGETGDRAVKLSPLIFHPDTKTYCIARVPAGCSVIHAGIKKFEKKLTQAVVSLAKAMPSDRQISEMIEKAQRPLVTVGNKQQYDEVTKKLTKLLVRSGLQAKLAEQVVSLGLKTNGTTTVWQLYLLACKLAQQYPQTQAQRLREFAFDILTGAIL